MVMNISCKFEKASYNIFFVRAATVKSLYTLRRRRGRNEAKSIVSTRCYPVDTNMKFTQYRKFIIEEIPSYFFDSWKIFFFFLQKSDFCDYIGPVFSSETN